MRTGIALSLAFLLCAVAAAGAFAAEISGAYRIELDGKLIGAEKFSVYFKSDGSIKTSSTASTREDEITTESFTEAQFRATGEIKDYQREVYINRVPRKLTAVNQGPHLLVQINTGVVQNERKIPIHQKATILDVGTFHHYHLVLKRYSRKAKGKQTFWAVSPSETLERKVVVEFLESTTANMENGYFLADKYFVNQGDVGVYLWVDERERIFKIEVPMQGLAILLKGYKGKRAEKAIGGKAVVISKLTRRDISFTAKDGTTMAGSLTRPPTMTGPLPAVVFASASGPQDRDGTNTIGNIPTHTGSILDRISREGYLVLRYDDRGVGKSAGDYAQSALSKQEGEIEGALDFLAARPDVDAGRLALIGHGEGANAVMRVASRRKDVKAVILLAPSSIKLSDLAIRQIKSRMTDQGVSDPQAYTRSPIFTLINMARTTKKEFHILGGRAVYLTIFREWDAMNPPQTLGKIGAPVLHVQGSNDRQVFPDLAKKLTDAPKKGKYTFKQFEGLDHFFVKSGGSIGEYSNPNRKIDLDFLNYLVAWLGANL